MYFSDCPSCYGDFGLNWLQKLGRKMDPTIKGSVTSKAVAKLDPTRKGSVGRQLLAKIDPTKKKKAAAPQPPADSGVVDTSDPGAGAGSEPSASGGIPKGVIFGALALGALFVVPRLLKKGKK